MGHKYFGLYPAHIFFKVFHVEEKENGYGLKWNEMTISADECLIEIKCYYSNLDFTLKRISTNDIYYTYSCEISQLGKKLAETTIELYLDGRIRQ